VTPGEPETTRGEWALRAVWFVLAAVVAWGFTTWIGLRPRPALVIAVLLGGFAIGWLVTDVGRRTVRVEWTPPRRRITPRHGLDPRFLRLASLMRDETDRRLVSFRVHQTLVRIVDDRLQSHHGIDRATQPEQAAALLGPDVSQYVDRPPATRDLHPGQLDDLITRIEAL
jgi:hypothetical protein